MQHKNRVTWTVDVLHAGRKKDIFIFRRNLWRRNGTPDDKNSLLAQRSKS